MDSNRPGILWKVVPALFVLLLILAGGTDLFSVAVHQAVAKVLMNLGGLVLPFAINCVIGLVIISVANHLYKPLLKGAHKLLDSSHANQRAKDLVRRGLQALYWLVVAFLVMSVVAPDLITKVLSNLVLFGAAVVVALQDMAKDVAGGFVLQFSPSAKKKFGIGDKIAVVGLDAVTGVVKDIELLTTRIETEKGLMTVPNRELWSRAVLIINPPPSPIIMPPGVERPKPPVKPADSSDGSNPLGLPNLFLGFGKDKSSDTK